MREKGTVSTRKIFRNAFWFVVGLVVIIAAGHYFSVQSSIYIDTPVYEYVKEFEASGTTLVPSDYRFADDSAEMDFVKAMLVYSEGEYTSAKKLFQKVEEKLDSIEDPALPFYVYCYMNKCDNSKYRKGKLDYVKKMVDSIAGYPPLGSEHEQIWQAVNSIATDSASNKEGIKLITYVLENAKNLSFDAKVHYGNCIAYLEYIDGDFDASIRSFYDVKLMFDGVKDTDYLISQKIYTNSYIARLHYKSENLEAALALFEENIDFPIEDPVLNAEYKAWDYIYLSRIYLDKNDTKGALDVCHTMEEIIPYVQTDIKSSVYAQVCDVHARAAIMEGDFATATDYIKKAEAVLDDMSRHTYLETASQLELTKGLLTESANK